ncbi:MAG: hypothetical protein HUJ80_04140 [Firmicutes bacterium]|nr:hypothetical protein [Bacillota bacterium]
MGVAFTFDAEAFASDLEELIGDITGIVQETGYSSIGRFPTLYTATTEEDKQLEADLNLAVEDPSAAHTFQLASALRSYIELDDINMGLMALAAEKLVCLFTDLDRERGLAILSSMEIE